MNGTKRKSRLHSVISVIGVLCIFICFLLSFLSFASPFWLHSHTEYYDMGLWGKCFFDSEQAGRSGCRWMWQFGWAMERAQTSWFKACQGLFGFGLLTLLVAFVLACADICCQLHKIISNKVSKKHHVFYLIGVVMLLAALQIGLAVSIFGGLAWKRLDTSIHSAIMTFSWAYHVGIAVLILNFLTATFYLTTACMISQKQAWKEIEKGHPQQEWLYK